ncbi:MAG: 16S rRNA (cytosine(1402)-N(4))-methyltransferase RsmH [Micropepsaceae bacterium]
MSPTIHLPVLMQEVLEALKPKDGDVIVDGTFGGGSYSRGILRNANCRVIGLDRDPAAIARGKEVVREFPGRLALVNGTFGSMQDLLSTQDIETVDGIVLDLGVSSDQLEVAERGFSIQHDGPLDMRMGNTGISAAGVVNTYSEQTLAGIIYVFGEEMKANSVARAIVAARAKGEITRTGELASLCARVVGRQANGIHPATRTFQALRIHVNDELGELARGLNAAEALLKPGGRLVIVSFHSLEDRMVKRFLSERCGKPSQGSRHMPVAPAAKDLPSFTICSKKAVVASREEIARNARSRSAKLRFATRTIEPAIPFDPVKAGVMPEVRA